MRTEKLSEDKYDKYMIKKDFKLPEAKDLSLSARKRRYYATCPVDNKKVLDRFKKAYHKIRCVLSWRFMIDEIQLYGTGSSLFSANFAYKTNINTVMDQKRLDDSTDKTNQDFSWKHFLLHPGSRFKLFWDFLMFLQVMYTIIMIPVLLAFYQGGNQTFSTIDLSLDISFAVDIIIILNTALIDKNKKPVKDRKKIFLAYLKGLLIVDIISVFPFWAFDDKDNGKSLKLLRVLRLLRLGKMVKLENVLKKIPIKSFQRIYNSVEGLNRLFAGLFLILLMIHLVSCAWNYSSVAENFHPDTWIVRNGLQDASPSQKYLRGVYFAFTVLMTVGFGDIYAITKTEMAICIVWEFIGIAFYSFVFGTISSVLTSMDQKNAALTKKLQIVELLAKDTNIPQELVKRINKEIKESSNTLSLDYDEKIKLVSNLPKNLRYTICGAMYEEAAKKLFFFKDKPMNFTADIFPRLVYLVKRDREFLYSKGDFPDEMYFLISGRISFVFGKQNMVFKSMIAGSYFGEIELIEQKPREFGVMASGTCSLLVMPKSVFAHMMRQYPKVSHDVKEVAKIKKVKIDSAMQDIIELLDNVDIRKEKTLSEIAGTLKPYKSKEYIKRDSQKNLTEQNNLYGIEYQNRYLKYTIAQIHSKIDELERKMLAATEKS